MDYLSSPPFAIPAKRRRFLILSALASLDERVKGLRGGGDDYLTNRFVFQSSSRGLSVASSAAFYALSPVLDSFHRAFRDKRPRPRTHPAEAQPLQPKRPSDQPRPLGI